MLNGIEERIEYFFNAIKSIKEHTDKIDLEFAHTPIYFILLDILAKYAFPNENKGNMRFLNLIDSYSNWEYKNYVSILLLKDLLEIEKNKKCFKENKDYEDLWEKVNETRNKWGQNLQKGKIYIPKEADLTIDKFNFLNKDNRYWGLIKKCRYSSCIYQMRNGIIHDFTSPSAPDWCNESAEVIKVPRYFYSSEINAYTLRISHKFIPILLEECFSNLKVDTMQKINKYDPYKIYKKYPDWFPIDRKNNNCIKRKKNK